MGRKESYLPVGAQFEGWREWRRRPSKRGRAEYRSYVVGPFRFWRKRKGEHYGETNKAKVDP